MDKDKLNIIDKNEQEYIKRQKARTKAVVRKISELAGVILLIFVYIETMLSFGSMSIFTNSNPDGNVWQYWSSMGFLGFRDNFPRVMISIVMLFLTIGMIYLISFNISGLIIVIRNFFKAGGNIFSDIRREVKSAIDENELLSIKKNQLKEKSGFFDIFKRIRLKREIKILEDLQTPENEELKPLFPEETEVVEGDQTPEPIFDEETEE